MSKKHELWCAAIAAEECFSAALKLAFGRDACNRRYDADESNWPDYLKRVAADWHVAVDAWIGFLRSGGAK